MTPKLSRITDVAGGNKKAECENTKQVCQPYRSDCILYNIAQEGRLEDLRDTHRLESNSQSEQIEQLRRRLSETEALLEASQDVVARGQGDSAQNKAETDRLNAEVEKFKALAKEEEEKRVKAISLLKTVRQKLVKAEKEKEEAVQELNSAKDRDKEGAEKEQAEKLKLREEVETARAERERSLQALKIQFDKEIANIRDRHEKELSALKGQLELEALNAKVIVSHFGLNG